MFKRCPFCHKFVWFWQSKAYLDAKKKQPCHAVCLFWDMVNTEREEDHLIMVSPNTGWLKKGTRKKEVEKVQDDTWRRGVEK